MKLVESNIKNFFGTLNKSLAYTKSMCEVYIKNDTNSIDDPNALNELWDMIENCEADLDAVTDLYDDMNKWYHQHITDHTTMLGYTLQSIFGSVGLIKLQMEIENAR